MKAFIELPKHCVCVLITIFSPALVMVVRGDWVRSALMDAGTVAGSITALVSNDVKSDQMARDCGSSRLKQLNIESISDSS